MVAVAVREVSLGAFALALADDVVVLDVRDQEDYLAGHVPGARPVPLDRVADQLGELSREEPVYVICARGDRARGAAGWLRAHGLEAYSVAGGTAGWARTGRRLVPGPYQAAAA